MSTALAIESIASPNAVTSRCTECSQLTNEDNLSLCTLCFGEVCAACGGLCRCEA